MTSPKERRIALTIAGSDPGGGAGVQADLKSFAALGVYGYSVITAVIAQNSATVRSVVPVEPAMVAAQLETLAAERIPDAVKTGALGNAAIVEVVAEAIARLAMPAPVVDPVMIATSGASLLDGPGRRALAERLIPIARVVTPNIPEAQALSGIAEATPAALREMARSIHAMGARAVVIKGGHREAESAAIDLLYDDGDFIEIVSERIGGGAHGTGCAFSAAIAAGLAHGLEIEDAVRDAKDYVTRAIRASFTLGAGRPLLDHFARD